MATRPLILGCLGVLAVVVCACSSGTGTAQSTSGSATATTPPTAAATTSAAASSSSRSSSAAAPTVSPAGADQLTPIVLRATDLPTGWRGTAYKPDPADAATNAAFAACLGARNTSLDQVADVHSQNFSMGNATLSSDAASYPSSDDLAADRALLTNAKYPSCFEAGLRAALGKALPAGATISSIDAKVTPGAGGGPSNVAGTVAATVTVVDAGLTRTFYSTTVVIMGPLIETTLSFSNLALPVPAALQATLIGEVAARTAHP